MDFKSINSTIKFYNGVYVTLTTKLKKVESFQRNKSLKDVEEEIKKTDDDVKKSDKS